MLPFALLSAAVWGVCVALFIEQTWLGRWLNKYMTWFVVSVGVGGDLLIALLLMDSTGRVAWWQLVAVIALSSIALATRGLLELHNYFRGLMDAVKNTSGEQDHLGA